MTLLSDRILNIIRNYYPALVNGTVHPFVGRIIRQWIRRYHSEIKRVESLESLRLGLKNQPLQTPSPLVYQRVQKQLPAMAKSTAQAAYPWQYWLVPLLFLLLAAVLIRIALPPVIPVNWSAEGQGIESFRVYRSAGSESQTNGSADSRLVYEISANRTQETYGFVDLPLLPSNEIVYRIDALGKDDLIADTATLVSDGLSAFVSQLLLLIITALAAYILWSIAVQFIDHGKRKRLNPA